MACDAVVTVINGATNATTSIDLETGANNNVAVNSVTNKIYVLGGGGLAVIDGATNIVTTVTVGDGANTAAVNLVTDKIYVANEINNTVTVVDGATNATTTVTEPNGSGPVAVAVNPVTNKIYVANINGTTVTVIDGATDATTTVTDPSAVSPLAVAVNPASNQIYVANQGSNSVTVTDGATDTTTSVGVGDLPAAVALNPVTNNIYVANQGSNNVTVIDGSTNATTTVADPNASGPAAVAVNPATNKVYVANQGSNNVTVIDGATNAIATVGVGKSPSAVAVNPATNEIYVVNQFGGTVTVINGITNATTTVGVGSLPVAVAVNPGTNQIYVANYGSRSLTEINGATNATTTVEVGTLPIAVAVNPATDQIYVANEGSNNVTVINGATNSTTTVANPGTQSPIAVAVNPVTNKIYVANSGTSNLTVIDGATNTTTTLAVGNNPAALAVNPVTNQIYVANESSDNLTVITEQQVQLIPLETDITPLPDNLTTSLTPTFSFTAASFFLPNTPNPDNLLFQVDTWQGPWTAAASTGGGSFDGAVNAPLPPGVHILYAYATDGQDSTSTNTGQEISPLIGNIAAYLFLVAPPSGALSPASLAFGDQVIGTMSVSQPVTLTNSSFGPLTITDITASGGYSASTCGTTLGAGASCTIDVAFTPTTAGTDNGSLFVVGDFNGVNQVAISINLTGTGVLAPPLATLSPTSLSFNPQLVGTTSTSQAITVTNTGNSALIVTGITPTANFAVAGMTPCNNLAPTASCMINVTFTPTVAGPLTGTLTIIDNNDGVAGSTQTAPLSGTGTAPVASLSPMNLSFLNQAVGTTSAAQAITLSNTGNNTLIITVVSTTANFGTAAGANPCGSTLAASASCKLYVTFSPTTAGNLYGSLTVGDNSNGVGSTQTVPLSGTGTAPMVALSPLSLSFGNQLVGTTSTSQPVTLSNTGNQTLSITSILASTGFGQTNNCTAPLAPSTSCTLNVTFTPEASGAFTGTITIADNASGSPQSVALMGAGIVTTTLTVTPASATFASQALNTTSAAKTVTVKNTGANALTFASITPSGDFAETDNCTGSIAPGKACTLNLTFTPTATGTRTGAITLTDNASGSPQTVSLTGTGVAQATLAPASVTFAPQTVGTTSTAKTVMLTNNLSTALTMGTITFTGADPGDFASPTNTCGASVPAKSHCTISVTFTPTATGTRTATVNINDSANNSPQAITLTGTGK